MDNEKLIPTYVLAYSLVNLVLFTYAIFVLNHNYLYFLLMIFMDSLFSTSMQKLYKK